MGRFLLSALGRKHEGLLILKVDSGHVGAVCPCKKMPILGTYRQDWTMRVTSSFVHGFWDTWHYPKVRSKPISITVDDS
jgi:hypothetical protein